VSNAYESLVRNVEARERLVRDWMIKYLHDLGHLLSGTSLHMERMAESRGIVPSRMREDLAAAIAALTEYEFEGRSVMEELYRLDAGARNTRYANRFLLHEIVADSISKSRAEFEDATVQLIESYEPSAPVSGCEPDFRFAIEVLVDLLLSSYREDGQRRQADSPRKMTVRVCSVRIEGKERAEMQLRSLGGAAICNPGVVGRQGRSRNPASWMNARFGRFSLFLAHRVMSNIGGTLTIASTVPTGNSVTVSIPAGERRRG